MTTAFIWGLIGALSNRIRGGLIHDITGVHISETILRICMAFCFALMVYTLYPRPLILLMNWVAFYAGLVPGWGKWWTVDTPKKIIIFTLRGIGILAPSAFIMWAYCDVNPVWALAGALMPVCYKCEWILDKYFPNGQHLWRKVFDAEVWFGFILFYLSYRYLKAASPHLTFSWRDIWDILDPRSNLKSWWDFIQHILDP